MSDDGERVVVVAQAPVSAEGIGQLRAAAPGLRIVTQLAPDETMIARAEVYAGHLDASEIRRAARLRWNHVWSAGADAELPEGMVQSDVLLTTSAGNVAAPLAEHAMLSDAHA